MRKYKKGDILFAKKESAVLVFFGCVEQIYKDGYSISGLDVYGEFSQEYFFDDEIEWGLPSNNRLLKLVSNL